MAVRPAGIRITPLLGFSERTLYRKLERYGLK